MPRLSVCDERLPALGYRLARCLPLADYDGVSSSDARRPGWSSNGCANRSGAQFGSPALQVLEPAQCRQCSAGPSSNEHFVPNKMKPDNTRGFPCSSISEMAVNRVFNHRTKLFNAFCLCHDRMPETSGYESPIYLVFTYFKKDLLHFNGLCDSASTLA